MPDASVTVVAQRAFVVPLHDRASPRHLEPCAPPTAVEHAVFVWSMKRQAFIEHGRYAYTIARRVARALNLEGFVA